MKYKAGDKVKIKSLDWYNQNKNHEGNIDCANGYLFTLEMTSFCGATLTIEKIYAFGSISHYSMKAVRFAWTDDMIEGLVDARETPVEHPCDWLKRGLNLPDGYEFQDENGNVINTKKIILVKKKPKYPTTYKECCNTMQNTAIVTYGHKSELIYNFHKLLVCRDAYWKIAGEEMGLGKSWEPDLIDEKKKYTIYNERHEVQHSFYQYHNNRILIFPTEEMRDAFYENFKDLINECKELL